MRLKYDMPLLKEWMVRQADANTIPNLGDVIDVTVTRYSTSEVISPCVVQVVSAYLESRHLVASVTKELFYCPAIITDRCSGPGSAVCPVCVCPNNNF